MASSLFDVVMRSLPVWLPCLLIALLLQWLVIRGAVLSALRRHAHDRRASGLSNGTSAAQE